MDLKTVSSAEFEDVIKPYRYELQVHCYRMMGTIQDAEDMVQETFIRAWRNRDSYAGRASVRAWLYKIATNACLDALKKQKRRSLPSTYEDASTSEFAVAEEIREPIWLQPYPDELLPDSQSDPVAIVTEREHITMAFVTLLHLLPPRQRAVLILRDVLNWKASEVADLMDSTVSAVKSILHRARVTLTENDGFLSSGDDFSDNESKQNLVNNYVQAWQNADVDTLMQLLTADATFSMPPIPSWYRGQEQVRWLLSEYIFAGGAVGRWQLTETRANRQLAFTFHLRTEENSYDQPYGIQILTVEDNKISNITTFRSPDLVSKFEQTANN